MKVNKIMLLSIFLLAVLTLGVASASENTTDNLKIDDAVDVSSSADGNIVADEGSGQPKDVEIVLPDSIKAYEEFNINVTLPEDAYGEVSYYFDDNEDDEDSSYVYPGFNQISLKIREFGTHTLNVDFTSEDCEICNDKVVSKKYNPQFIIADKAYDTNAIRTCINEEIKASDQIPLKSNFRHGWYRRLSIKKKKKEIYSRRSNVESIFSVIKRKYSGINKSKSTRLQNKETRLKTLVYNIDLSTKI